MGGAARAILCGIVLVVGLGSAAAADRIALVIGNGEYKSAEFLRNAPNDARAMAAALARVGFTVIDGIDLDHKQMRRAFGDFRRMLVGAEVGLFFYAGHGLQVDGENWLLPVDAELADEFDLEDQALELGKVIDGLERMTPTSLVFLDACRNNPFLKRMTRGQTTRSIGRGLAKVEAGKGTLIAFATDPGNVALDGDGENSPFTGALLRHLETPGLEVEVLIKKIRKEVDAATDGRQTPWSSSSLLNDFYFVPAEAYPAPSTNAPVEQGRSDVLAALGRNTVADRGTLEQTLWESVQKISDPAHRRRALEDYLGRFPDGAYAAVARIQIDDLGPASGEAVRSAGSDLPSRERVKDAVLLAAKIAEDGRKLHAAATTQGGAAAQLATWRVALADMPPEAAERRTRSADIERLEDRLRALEPRIVQFERSLASSFQDYLGLIAALGALPAEALATLVDDVEREISEGAGKHLVSAQQFAVLRAHLQEWLERAGEIDGETRERWLQALDEQRRERLELAIVVPKLASSP